MPLSPVVECDYEGGGSDGRVSIVIIVLALYLRVI